MRFNIFNQIHKALRALLYDTSLTVQQSNFANPEEVAIALDKIRKALDIFDKHAAHEDKHVLPAIQQFEPSMVDAFEQEHVEDHALAEKLRALISDFGKAETPTKQLVTGKEIMHAFNAFLSFNLDHMAKEESVINDRLWRYYNDQEIMEISQKILADIDQDEMAFASAWMMKGLSNAEITSWLKSVQSNAPEFMFNALFATAEKELSPQRFRKVLENLTEGAMLA